jgi:hypothetical protein
MVSKLSSRFFASVQILLLPSSRLPSSHHCYFLLPLTGLQRHCPPACQIPALKIDGIYQEERRIG